MSIISKVQIPGYCKKVKNKELYSYPETPASIYRLAKTGDDQWGKFPHLKEQWDSQLQAIKIAREYYETRT